MAAYPMIAPVERSARKMRRPLHTALLKHKPWTIQPFLVAPVLPGETLKKVTLQSRVVSDPINNSLIGWWCEYFLFYVKHRDMTDVSDKLQEMVLDPNADLSSLDYGTVADFYHTNGTDLAINWARQALIPIVQHYFRQEGEVFGTAAIGNLPAASVNRKSFIDSAVAKSVIEGASYDEDLTSVVAGQGDATTAVTTSEIDQAMRRYQAALSQGLVDMTYEDFLATYGVVTPTVQEHVPELLRYHKEWTYPTNTIDPSNGTPRSAVSWAVSMRADKDRFFKEPGFIIGVTVVRPKVYFKNLTSNAAMLLKDAYSWLPAVMSDDPWTSLRKVTSGDPPIDNSTSDYYVDVKDLFLYGDQFLNYTPSATDSNAVDLPTTTLTHAGKHYPDIDDAKNLFVDYSVGTATNIKQDIGVQLDVLGRLMDTTPNFVGSGSTV